MPKTRRHAASVRGFTLIELMVVLVIIGVLAALIVPNVLDRADDARVTAARTDVNNLVQALKLYRVKVLTGDGGSAVSTVGILGEPLIIQVGASTLGVSDTTGRRSETTRYQTILQGSGGLSAPPGLSETVDTYPGRLSWREITNYQELRNAP